MKKIVFLITLCSVFHSYGQVKIINNPNPEKMDSLDNLYQTLITDTFPGINQRVVPEYSRVLEKLEEHLTANDFYWDNNYKIYARFYADRKGNIETFLYQFSEESISDSREKELNRLLKSYFLENKFDLEKAVAIPFSVEGCTSFKATKAETKN